MFFVKNKSIKTLCLTRATHSLFSTISLYCLKINAPLLLVGLLVVPMSWTPAFAQAIPLNLTARPVPGGIEVLYNSDYKDWFLTVARVPAWGPNQSFQRFSLWFQDANLTAAFWGGMDPYVTVGTTDTYSFSYPNDPGVNGSVSIKYAPACTFSGHCPAGAGQPQQYTINCRQPADFYTSSTETQAAADSTTNFSGVGITFPSSTAITFACVPITIGSPFGGPGPSSGLCSGFSQTVNVSSCPVPPPVNRSPVAPRALRRTVSAFRPVAFSAARGTRNRATAAVGARRTPEARTKSASMSVWPARGGAAPGRPLMA
ncbi:hypothetical protein [Beijerinckia sp. L45]|uniref:hypothetical protein n=1 Tax=Beijerinckia sp. L45 TaxID=1641855 RepID=UPI00131C2020|nr:hypothetical protein [Beijerinckia sp. L45]